MGTTCSTSPDILWQWNTRNSNLDGTFRGKSYPVDGCVIFCVSFLAVAFCHTNVWLRLRVNTGGERCNNRVAMVTYTRSEGSGICICIECGEP